jgi:site-specific recombinase
MPGIVRRWKQAHRARMDLDVLLSLASPQLPVEDRIEWLVELLIWMRSPGSGSITASDASQGLLPAARLRFLMQVLDRHPEWKTSLARTLRSLVRDLDALDLFCQTGLPVESGFLSEAFERLLLRILPQAPRYSDLGEVFGRLFPTGEDLLWLERLDGESLHALAGLFAHEVGDDEEGWNSLQRDMERALLVLGGDVRSLAFSPALRRRLGQDRFEDFPFFRILPTTEKLVTAVRSHDHRAVLDAAMQLRANVADSELRIRGAFRDLGRHGVSVDLVYRLDRMQAQLARLRRLLRLLVEDHADFHAHIELLKDLVRENDRRRGLSAFFTETLSLLSRKISERSADAGEHYIARDRRGYFAMIRSALGGGALTGFTALVKIFVEHAPIASFMRGLLASLNYSVSFVFIQACGFTLATKQPAMTAPALAARMENLSDASTLRDLVSEIVCLVRTQGSAVIGNLAAVIPVCFLIDAFALNVVGDRVFDESAAREILRQHSFLGPSLFYAAFTGVLLWASSMAAGWVDNASTYRRIPEALAASRRLNHVFGTRATTAFAERYRKILPGLAGSVSLGFLLGLAPKILAFLGLPIEVRHVTLGMGTVAFALSSLKMQAFETNAGLWALLGILGIGGMNLLVSFALAMIVAMRARKVRAPERGLIYRALGERLRRNPLSFFWPER